MFPTKSAPSKLGETFKAKKIGTNGTHIVLVLDESGSMRPSRMATISGVNEFMGVQKEAASKRDTPTFVSLYKFDGYNTNGVFIKRNILEVQDLTAADYDPTGMTNLHDAIFSVVAQINEDLGTRKKKNREAVMIAIMTDGEENSSKIATVSDVKQIVEKCEGKDWSFMFLGANIDSFQVGQTMGFKEHMTAQYNTNNMGATLRTASAKMSEVNDLRLQGMGTQATYDASAFTSAERASMVEGQDEQS